MDKQARWQGAGHRTRVVIGGSLRRGTVLVLVPMLLAACSSSTGSPGSSSPETFTSSSFEVPLGLTLVDGWVVQADDRTNIDLQRGDQDASISSIASTTVAAPNASDPPVAWPSDLYSWLVDRPEFDPTQPQDVTVGGRPGVLIDALVTPKTGTSIQMVGFGTGSFFLVDRPERWRFIEVKTGQGSGIVILTTAPPDAYAASWKALDQLVATLRFH